AAHVGPEPQRLDAPTDVLDLGVPYPWLQNDDHCDSLPAVRTRRAPKKAKGTRAASPSPRAPWCLGFAIRQGAAGQTVAKVVAEEPRPTRSPRPHGGPHGKGSRPSLSRAGFPTRFLREVR